MNAYCYLKFTLGAKLDGASVSSLCIVCWLLRSLISRFLLHCSEKVSEAILFCFCFCLPCDMVHYWHCPLYTFCWADCNRSFCKFSFYRRKTKWLFEFQEVRIVELWVADTLREMYFASQPISCCFGIIYVHCWRLPCHEELRWINNMLFLHEHDLGCSHIWTDVDNNRTGDLPFVFEDDFG